MQIGGLGLADAVLDACVCAAASFEGGDLPGAGVSGEGLVAPAVAFFEGVELGSGMGGVRGES